MTFNKTVLQIIPALDAGGAERTTVEIAEALVKAGGRALVATRGGRLAGDIEKAGGEIFPAPMHSKNPAVIWGNRNRLIRLIGEARPDILHVRSRAPAWSALWAARATKTPLVATYHGAYEAGDPIKRFYNSAMVRADLVIANSEFTANAIRRTYGVPKGRLVVIPRGADLARFDPETVSAERVAELTRAWGGAGAFRLLLPGRLTDWKGHREAIEAVARLTASSSAGAGKTSGLRLILCGDSQGRDEYVRSLRELIEGRGVRDVIEIVGHCADMPAAYRWADAVLTPSTRPEAFGRVAVEAGAMGAPVIAADHGGARETIIDDETGLLTPPGDIVALSEAIEMVRDAPDATRREMGVRARAHIAENFSTHAMCKATLEAYEGLLKT